MCERFLAGSSYILLFYHITLVVNVMSQMLCILTSECMLAHAFAQSKTIKSALKLIFLREP